MLQIEEKTYSTPAVRSQLSGFSQQGYNARPASVDLMIHGNVGTGTTFKDSSPRRLALTNTNGVSHADTSKFGGSALKFVRSSTQWIQTASTDAANFGTGDWTIDYWFNMTSGQTDRMHALDLGVYASSNISLNFNDGNAFWLYWNGSGGNNIIWGSDGDYGDGAWHHMAVTRRLGMIRVWVDGVHKGSNNYSSSTSMGTTNYIDIGASGGGVLWDGYLDEIRITKGTALWYGGISGTGNFTPPTRRSNDGPVLDLSGSNKSSNLFTTDMTDVKANRRGQVIEPVANAIWNFDGTDDYMRGAQPTGQVGSTTTKTYEYWFKMQSFPPQAGVLTMGSDDANNYKWQYVYVGANGYVQFLYGNNSNYNIYGGSAQQVVGAANVWTCLTISIDISRAYDDRLKIYKNGESISVSWNTGGSYPRTAFYDGSDLRLYTGVFNYQSPFSGSTFFDGEIGKISIWKTGLSHDQVKQNFNANRGRFGV